ncbi:hypothetical protein K474DRAFT_1655583 [Panus rudis PR-1116 ss-1]|nr:hypothetical protein K474DRAFT_1655583 [Panus rudis PR-1116 ss-1]
MLKRQRPSSPIPLPMETQVEDDWSSSLYEPDSKRRRYFAPPSSRGGRAGEADSDDVLDTSTEDGKEEETKEWRYVSRKREWQETAGVYKNANSLLHDLHAEQRHRMLFSSSSSPQTRKWTHPSYDYSSHVGKSDHSAYAHNAIDPSSLASPDEHETAHGADEAMETETVISRYEHSNRILRSLFLSRRQELDDRQVNQTS